MLFLRSSKKSSWSDEQLISEFLRTGNQDVLGFLFDRYNHLVFAVAFKYLKEEENAKDCVLFIFEKLAGDLRKYQIRNFGNWIHSVTRNYCLRELSRMKRMPGVELEEQLAEPEADFSPDESTLVNLKYLNEALATLNKDQRRCVELFYIEEKSYNQISEATGFDYRQVKSFIQNGKRNLRIYLLKKNHEGQ